MRSRDLNDIHEILVPFFPGESIEVTPLVGGMRFPCPLQIRTPSTRYVWRELGENRKQALYVIEFSERLRAANLPIAKSLSLQKETPNEEQFLSSYNYEGKTKYFVVQEFLPNGFFIERDARISPSNAYYKDIYAYYEEIGRLSAIIQNVTWDWVPNSQHRYKTRREIAQNIINGYQQNLRRILETARAQESPNASHAFFIDNFDSIQSAYEKSLNQFATAWDANMTKDIPMQHIHNDLHFGNILFDENKRVVGLIDFGQAQMDHRAVEVSNCLLGISSPSTPLTQTLFDLPSIQRAFTAYFQGFQKEATNKFTDGELLVAWEILRLRLVEYLYQNQLGVGRPTSAFDNAERFKSLRDTFVLIEEFPVVDIANVASLFVPLG